MRLTASKKRGGSKLIGVYFSGTGNTKHCVEQFVAQCDHNSTAVSIETPGLNEALAGHNMIVFGYPVYFSNAPKIVRDFIAENKMLFQGKEIFIIATMGLFSGDGAGCAARLFRKCHAKVVGGLHLKMPDCIGDEKAMKKPLEANKEIVRQADAKIALAAVKFKEGTPVKVGLNVFYHIAGLFGQRLWFYGKTMTYKEKPNVDRQKCIGCGRCSELCPMRNIEIAEGKAVSHNQCTLCYRCFSHCTDCAKRHIQYQSKAKHGIIKL